MRPAPIAAVGTAALVLSASAFAGEPRLLSYFTPQEIAERNDYTRPLYLKFAIDTLQDLLFLGLFLGLRLNRKLLLCCEAVAERLGARLARNEGLSKVGKVLAVLWGGPTWGGALLFVVAYFAINLFLSLPESFYFDWVRERRHGVSNETLGRWTWDLFKGTLASVLTLSCLAFGLYGLARRRKDWWLLLGLPCAVLMLGAGLLDPFRAKLYYDYVPVPDGEIRQKIVAVLKKAGVEYEGVFGIKMKDTTRRVNAYIVGEGPTRRIVLYDTLMEAMTPDEIANAVAHEVGHLRDRAPARPLMASAVLVPFLYLLARILRRFGRSGRLGFDGDHDVASLPAAFLFMWVCSTIANPASCAYSRYLEHRADAYALELLRQPEELRAMMVKLARVNLSDLEPPATWVALRYSHPPVLERIGKIEAFARKEGIGLEEPSPARFLTASTRSPIELARDGEVHAAGLKASPPATPMEPAVPAR
jgi:STE24 endopeptidase